MALHRFEQLDPEHDGPLAGAELEVHFRRMLCDKVLIPCGGVAARIWPSRPLPGCHMRLALTSAARLSAATNADAQRSYELLRNGTVQPTL